MYKLFTIKRYLEQVLMYPFILVGKLIARLHPLNDEFDIFFFFPGYGIGGAEYVNGHIIRSFPDKRVMIFFTKKSPNQGMLHYFKLPHVTYTEIDKWTDNKFIYWANFVFRGICSHYINNQTKCPIVFIGQCNFGYKLTPHIRKEIHIHELIHMFDKNFTWVWAPFIKFIHTRIILGMSIKTKFSDWYETNGIPLNYLNRFKIITNCLDEIPEQFFKRTFSLPLRIYYAGRGGPQKRLWLIIEIIKKCRLLNLPVTFSLAGSFKEEIPEYLISDSTYIGEIKGGYEMYDFHKNNDVLLMTSAWEGFPMVIMEAMAYGAVPLVPDIDAIPEHVVDGQTGFLIKNSKDEDQMVKDALLIIENLIKNPTLLSSISFNAYQYAKRTFSKTQFEMSYRETVA
jgi:glycosyltransferase involved in cell wall biosynthesis